LAMMVYTGAIAGEGKAAKPVLLRGSALLEKGEALLDKEGGRARAGKVKLLEAGTARQISDMMRNNVKANYGDSNYPGLSLHAKTGTAEVGKGKIIWACAPFESTSLTQPRKVFTSFVKKYVPEMSFASDDTPYVVEYQLWEDEEGKYLSAINLQYADEVLPVFDFNICIRTEKPAKITRVSDGREMGFEYSDGKLVLHIDRLDLYEMFDIQI